MQMSQWAYDVAMLLFIITLLGFAWMFIYTWYLAVKE